MRTISFAGDAGDLLYLLASLDKLEGSPFDLVLYPADFVREPFFPEKVDKLRPFLLQQPYLANVRYSDVPEGDVLDGWRKGRWCRNCILADMMAKFLGVPIPDRNKPWLQVDAPKKVAPVVFARSPRYRERSRFPWRKVFEKYHEAGVVFVGSSDEYDSLNHDVGGGLQWYRTESVLDLARVVAGAELFVGNQSMPFALAVGLGVGKIWLQQHRDRRGNCHWERAGMYYDAQKRFPELEPWSSRGCEQKPPAGENVEFIGGRVCNLDRLGASPD